MIPRPHYAQPGCVYFICLLRDDLLLRQGAHTQADSPFLSGGSVCSLRNSYRHHMTFHSSRIWLTLGQCRV